LLAYVASNPDATLNDIADMIGRSKSTVSNYVSELSEAGQLHKNGQGWEVISS
jgi:DNA-binding IclR family transcriptional regulator